MTDEELCDACGHVFDEHDETWKCAVDDCDCCMFEYSKDASGES